MERREITTLAPALQNSLTIGILIAGAVLILIVAVLIGYFVKKLWVAMLTIADLFDWLIPTFPFLHPLAKVEKLERRIDQLIVTLPHN